MNSHLARVLQDMQDAKTALIGKHVDYSAQSVADLKDAIAQRNEYREGGAVIKVPAPGNKPELIAALEDDDRALADAENHVTASTKES